jgi:hypothetical protein
MTAQYLLPDDIADINSGLRSWVKIKRIAYGKTTVTLFCFCLMYGDHFNVNLPHAHPVAFDERYNARVGIENKLYN